MPLLEVKGLRTYFYTSDGVVKAVDGVSFHVNEGETLGIVGESGCGKSMSVLSIMRLVPRPAGRIVAGEILFQGRDLLKLSLDEMRKVRGNQIAMIYQDPMTSLNPVLTVGYQIREALELHMGMSKSQSARRAAELLQMVRIPEASARMNDYPHMFSGGMRQRVVIAMALACNPKLLIADEPTTALDVTIQAQIVELVKSLRDELGMAILWITHDLGVIAGLADRMQVMYAGRVVEEAPVKELYSHPRHPYTAGLLGSLPRLDEVRAAKLKSIDGMPPDLIDLPPGCPFGPRCVHAEERCRKERPDLRPGEAQHRAACWVDSPGAPLPSGQPESRALQ